MELIRRLALAVAVLLAVVAVGVIVYSLNLWSTDV